MQKYLVILSVLFLLVSCGQQKELSIKMATTTSTDNTGLLDYLKPFIEKETNVKISWVAVGTGKALKLGKNCDVDMLMVHAPGAEKKYLKDGFGTGRKEIMYNDFIIIGPASDPAGIKGKSVAEALKTLAAKKIKFASRGDDSGTHKKEIKLWKAAGIKIPDRAKWYLQTGQGMINTINIAVEQDAYTMADRGTFIKYNSVKRKVKPVVICEGDKNLVNQYSVMYVNKKRCENVNTAGVKRIITWFESDRAAKLIGAFRLKGKKLFVPGSKK